MSAIRRDVRFAITPEWVLDAEISDRAARLYGVLARYADAEGESFPSRKTLAARMRCSVDSLDRAKQELVDIGALRVFPRPATDGGQTTNLYVLVSAEGGGRIAAAGGSRTPAAQNESHPEREIPTANAVGAQEIIGAYIDYERAAGYEVPRRTVGMIARNVGELLHEGQDPAVIVAALKLMSERRLHPSTLPTLIGEAVKGPPGPRGTRTQLELDYERLRGGSP